MTGWIIFGLEAALLIFCFYGSKWWIKNKITAEGKVPIGENEYMILGEDSPETITNMIAFAKEIFSKKWILKSEDEFSAQKPEDGFSTKVSIENNEITKVVVRTNRTNVKYDGKNVEVTNTANSKEEVIVFLTLMSWFIISFVPWFCGFIYEFIGIIVEIFL